MDQRTDRPGVRTYLAAVLLVCGCCQLYAAPANDNFANATVLSGNLPLSDSTTNILSTAEAGEPGHGTGAAAKSIWYSWKAMGDGYISADTSGSSIDTRLGVYVGNSVATLTTIGGNDDLSASTGTSIVIFYALKDTTYYFAIDGFNGAEGNTRITLQTPPVLSVIANDATATEAGDSASFTISRSGSTAATIAVFFDTGGTASAGADYTRLADSVQISSGNSSVNVTIAPIDDQIYEAPETVKLSIQPRPYYAVNLVSASATISINDNETVVTGKVGDTQFSHKRGFYTDPFDLTIQTATPGATIRYTLDGTIPSTSNGTTYSGPISILKTTTIRAMAYLAGMNPTNIDTQTFLFPADIVNQSPQGQTPTPGAWPPQGSVNGQTINYGMDPNIVNNAPWNATAQNSLKSIKTFSVVMNISDMLGSGGFYTNPSGSGLAWERACSLELIDPSGDASKQFQADCGIRLRGGFSRSGGNPKHGLRFYFRDQYGPSSLEFPLLSDKTTKTFKQFDLRTFQNYSWSFQGDATNFCAIRDVFSRDTQRDMGQNFTAGDYFHLYINGQYWGIYNTEERPEADFGATYYGGTSADYDVVKVDPQSGYTILATDGNMDAWTRLHKAALAGLTSDAAYFRIQGRNPDGTLNPTFENLLDVDNMIDYMLVIYYGGNLDAPISNFLGNTGPNNFFGSRNRNGSGGFRFFSHDAEHTLLNVNQDRTGPFAGTNALNKSNPQMFFQQCAANAEFKVKFQDHIQRHFFNPGGALTVASATARFTRRKNELDNNGEVNGGPIVAESARWGSQSMNKNNWLNCCNSILNSHIPARSNIVLNQFRARGWLNNLVGPTFSQMGGNINAGFVLTLTNPNGATGQIYYTTDGTDPRLLGGAANGDATNISSISGTVTLSATTTIRARILSSGQWSGIVEATFTTAQDFAGLKITEIMYDPPDIELMDGGEFEFLELKNTGSVPLNLSGCKFTDGFDYTFPTGSIMQPGQFYVLVSNVQQFFSKYPTITPFGTYDGRLSNSGERITLDDPFGVQIFSMEYDNKAPWPLLANGKGNSIVPIAPTIAFNMSDSGSWRASTNVGGSPGADDPAMTFQPVQVTEALTNSVDPAVDYVELYNPTASPADIGGWFLSDDATTPQKYRIADGTVMQPHTYLVFDETQFNDPNDTNIPKRAIVPFALSSATDSVFLFSANSNGTLTGYTSGFDFEGADPGVPFGRYVTSVGEVHFPAQLSQTKGQEESGPRIGPVVITEINYNPGLVGGLPGDEFVEIFNNSNAPVKLYDLANLANTWKMSGIDFDFPANQELAVNGVAVICAGDPVAFRQRYSVPDPVQIFGPFFGSLQNNGELIALKKPGEPFLDELNQTVVPYIVVDAVRYGDSAPWPTDADGGGPSLIRLEFNSYGNDPINWRSSLDDGGSPGRLDGLTPIQPTNLSEISRTDTQVDMQWTDQSLTEDGFVVVSSLAANGPWQEIGSAGAGITTLSATELTPATDYYFRVYAFNNYGPSYYSNVLHVKTNNAPPPATPLSPNATTAGSFALNLSWQSADNREDGFRVERSDDGLGGWTKVLQTGAGVTSAQDTGLEPDTVYYYRIQAFSIWGDSGYSVVVNARTGPPPPPTAPDNLNATPVSFSAIALTLRDNSHNEVGFHVERSLNGNDGWSPVSTLPPNAGTGGTVSFTDLTCLGATRYYYRARSFHNFFESVNSATVNALTPQPPPPTTPKFVAAQALTFSKVKLTWQDTSFLEEGFKIERSFDGVTGWTQIGTAPVDDTQFTDKNLSPLTHYYYRVKAYHTYGQSPYSNVASAVTPPPTPPITPSDATAVANGIDKIDITWTDNSDNEAGFLIERSLDGVANWVEAGRTAEDVAAFQDAGLQSDTVYYYRISAFHEYASSGYSGVASSRTKAPVPGVPSNLIAVAVDDTKIDLTWTAGANTETFSIQRSSDGISGWAGVGSTLAGVTTFRNSGLSAATLYYYRVFGVNGAGSSDFSNIASATTFSPTTVDTDHDSYPDQDELYVYGTNPNNPNSKPSGIADLDSDGSTDDHDADDDGDTVDTAQELTAGTNPFDGTSYPTTPMTVTKMQAKANFKVAGKDSASLSLLIPAQLALAGSVVTVNVGGGVETFPALDTKGKAKSAHGTLAFTQNKRSPGATLGAVKLVNENWVPFWLDEGYDPANPKVKKSMTFVVEIRVAGKIFKATVPGVYSNGGFKGSSQ